MASNGIAALNELLQEMQALMGILPVAMVPLSARPFVAVAEKMDPDMPSETRAETRAEADARIEAGFDNLPV